MKCAVPELPLTLLSPDKRVRAEVRVETVWLGATVYPECPVWRVWYDGRPVVDTSTLGLVPRRGGPLACGMRAVKATRHRAQTGIGPGREARVRFAGRDGRELEARVRVTDMSAFCAVRVPRSRTSGGADVSVTRFPEGSVLLGEEREGNAQREMSNVQRPTSNAKRETLNVGEGGPQVRFMPSGKVVAFWRHGAEQHVVFFDRPGALAERCFAALERVESLPVADGRQGCRHLFLTAPFTKAALPEPVFGAAVTPAFREAFRLMLARGEACDDFWMARGEPGAFAVAARRQGGVWQVAGVTAAARTLTVRFEDFWLRMPAALRARRYTVAILRDPVKGEAGDRVEETFEGQAPDVRVALELAESGGFVIAFRGEAG